MISFKLHFQTKMVILVFMILSTMISLQSYQNDHLMGTSQGSSKFDFIFVVGIEGAGHHLFREMFEKSPMKDYLEQFKIVKHLNAATLNLYGHRDSPERGLLSRHCDLEGREKESTSQVVKMTASLFQKIALEVHNETFTIPMNANGILGSMISYPNLGGKCRSLNYPNLDIFYDICNQAGVKCGMVYIYRDPYDVIRSTVVKRKFNKSVLQAIHLYTSMLSIIHTQMTTNPNKTLGCFPLMEMDPKNYGWNHLAKIFGWKDPSLFHEMVEKYYDPPMRMTKEEKESLVPDSEYGVHMKAMIAMHDEVKKLCIGISKTTNDKA